MAQMVKITQVKSPIARPDIQERTLVALGLNKLHRSRVVADTPATRLLPERLEHARIDANSNQLTGFSPHRRPAHAAHGPQLLRRRVRNFREVNLSRRTPHVRAGSPAAR